MPDLVIYGVGSFARLMHHCFTYDSTYQVVAFTADSQYVSNRMFCGLPVVDFESVVTDYSPSAVEMFVAIGYRRMRHRTIMYERAKAKNYTLASYISTRAFRCPGVDIGDNTVAFNSVEFEPFAKVGRNNVFWSGALVGHDVAIGDGNFFGAACAIAGNCVVEDLCFVGIGGVVIDGVRIARETHILPGAVVMKDTNECHKYAGNPARAVGTHRDYGIVIDR